MRQFGYLPEVLTSFSLARNLVYCSLGAYYFVHVDISDCDYGCTLCSDRRFFTVGESFLSALTYSAVVLHHGDDYYEMVSVS